MRRLPVLSLAVILLSPPASAGEIRGRVRMVDGKRATVSALPFEAPFASALREARGTPSPEALARTVTDDDGMFALTVSDREDGEPRLFDLLVEGEGIVSMRSPLVYDSSWSEDVGDVAAYPMRPITGRALDTGGAPVAGAELVIPAQWFGNGRQWIPLRQATTSAEDGTFQIVRADDRLKLEITAPAAASLVVGTDAGYAGRPVGNVGRRQPPIALDGWVEAGDTVVSGALVRVWAEPSLGRWVETDDGGRFHIPDAPRGRVSIAARSADGRWAEIRDVTLPFPPEEGPLRIPLEKALAIEGRTVDAAGAPVPGVRVTAWEWHSVHATRSGRDGTFRIVGPPPTLRTFRADHPLFVPLAGFPAAVSSAWSPAGR